MPNLEPHQTDVLFLLIGANPLPNYVATCLLARAHGTVYLLHSEAEKNTYEVAARLKGALNRRDCRPDLTIHLRGIPRADPRLIRVRMATLLQEVPPASDVGLNYTGGTKPMAVHVYHVLRQAYPHSHFSYLDAASLTMIIDCEGTPSQYMPVGRSVTLDLQTLFGLHGYELEPPRRTALHPQFCRVLAEVHSTSQGIKAWRDWLWTLGKPDPCLPTIREYPALEPAIRGFADLCEGVPTEVGVAQALGYKNGLKTCATFFLGGWLEEYVFHALAQMADTLRLDDLGINLEPRKPNLDKFELDVVAMRSYQLFAISCMMTENKGKAKEHLFEVFVRARQVGGDEARCGLVCCVPNPAYLQAEIEETWDAAGKVQVFGQTDLLNLPNCLKSWFESANREV